jgi:uncharacterized protein DUF4214
MPNFGRVISLAYMRILERPPDPGGLASYNEAMNQGMTEAMMRESLIRSPEYAQKNPDLAPAAARAASRARKAAARRKKPSRRR